MTRAAAIAALVAIGLRSGLDVMPLHTVDLGSALGFIGPGLLAFAAVTATLYLACLARRIPDATRSQQMRRTARTAAVVFALTIVLSPFTDGPLQAWAEQSRLGEVLVMAGQVAAVGSLACAIWLMDTWWKFRGPLRQCLSEASGTVIQSP